MNVSTAASLSFAKEAVESFDETVARMLPIDRLNAARDTLRSEYFAGKPFPHVVMDGFFDEEVLDRIAGEFPDRSKRDWLSYDTTNEIKQTSRGIADLSAFTQAFFMQMCSKPMMDFLRHVTDHPDLVVDPLFHGGGLHESYRGGWLNVHADWTQHPVLPLIRRLNLIIYLNRDWDPKWGGALDLCDPVTKQAGASVVPLFNRAVIFPTTTETLHGFPDPMTCPPERSRKSISMFYWSPDPEAIKHGQFITFLPGKRQTRMKALVRSFIPPVTYTARDKLSGLLRGKRGGG